MNQTNYFHLSMLCVNAQWEKYTKFLSLDKYLPRCQFLQVLDFPDKKGPVSISMDLEWLCVLQSTNHLMHLGRSTHFMCGPQSTERNNFEVTDEKVAKVKELFGGSLKLPENFSPTAPALAERNNKPAAPPGMVNPQTALLCTMLDLTDPKAVHLGISNH
ncbi:lariat debranching enzyme-like [Babylonia areolata]|uniref:lariat debranching enzyme-like n=1 Tax=Babylonia areolata TaxID=304850 RepID=UPI003FCFDD07